MNHISIDQNPYKKPVRKWLADRYGTEQAEEVWHRTVENYKAYLEDLPDLGGKKSGHASAIYGGLLVFALYTALPDQPPVSELQDFVQTMFMGPFTKLGKIFNLNRAPDMQLINEVFRKAGDRDRKQITFWPAGFINVSEPYDKKHHAARYHFTQCPNAEFAKSHGLLHVLPLLCNSDFFGISEIHGRLIRCVKEEFLTFGYEKASLNRVSSKVGITTAGLYKHFKNKEDMFYCLVKDTLDAFHSITEGCIDQMETEKEYNPFDVDWAMFWVDFIYEHYDGVKLLICCAKGSAYENFEEELIRKEAKANMEYANILRSSGRMKKDISDMQWHILATAYVHLIFEVVRHGMSREEAAEHMQFVRNLLYPGWRQIYGL